MFYVTSKYRTKPDKMPRDCRRVCSLSSEQTKYLFLIKEVTCLKFCIWAPFQIQYQTSPPFKFQGKQKDIHRWSNNIADHLQLLLLMNYFTFTLFLINHRETSFNPPQRFDYVEFNWIRQHSSASLFLANYALLAHIKQHSFFIIIIIFSNLQFELYASGGFFSSMQVACKSPSEEKSSWQLPPPSHHIYYFRKSSIQKIRSTRSCAREEPKIQLHVKCNKYKERREAAPV